MGGSSCLIKIAFRSAVVELFPSSFFPILEKFRLLLFPSFSFLQQSTEKISARRRRRRLQLPVFEKINKLPDNLLAVSKQTVSQSRDCWCRPWSIICCARLAFPSTDQQQQQQQPNQTSTRNDDTNNWWLDGGNMLQLTHSFSRSTAKLHNSQSDRKQTWLVQQYTDLCLPFFLVVAFFSVSLKVNICLPRRGRPSSFSSSVSSISSHWKQLRLFQTWQV